MLATIQFKTENIQNYNIASCFVWLWGLVCHTDARTQTEDIWEQGTEDNPRGMKY
jgi:hypothetical protein